VSNVAHSNGASGIMNGAVSHNKCISIHGNSENNNMNKGSFLSHVGATADGMAAQNHQQRKDSKKHLKQMKKFGGAQCLKDAALNNADMAPFADVYNNEPGSLSQQIGEIYQKSCECAWCGKDEQLASKFQVCARCHLPRYCSRVCQKKHWKEGGHKQECEKADAKYPSFANRKVSVNA